MANKIRPQYIKAIRTAASKLWNDVEYHQWLLDNFEVKSTKDLSHSEAKEAVKILSNLTGYQHPKKRHRGSGGRNLSEAQANKIGALQQLLNWSEESLRKFMKRQTKKLLAVESLTHQEASKVIIGMQRILAKGDALVYNYLNTYQQTDHPDSITGKAVIKTIKQRISAHANG